MKLSGFNPTKKGAVMMFTDASQEYVAANVASYLQTNGFRLEGGTDLEGTWGAGSSTARVLAGGFSSRRKYQVSCVGQDPVTVTLTSAMSGWSGSWLGAIKEKRQRKSFAEQLRADFTANYR
jgi:hypothetical protein